MSDCESVFDLLLFFFLFFFTCLFFFFVFDIVLQDCNTSTIGIYRYPEYGQLDLDDHEIVLRCPVCQRVVACMSDFFIFCFCYFPDLNVIGDYFWCK